MAGGRTKGNTTGGGRVKGTPNKKSAELADIILKACDGRDPLVVMAMIGVKGVIPTQNPITKEWTDVPVNHEHRTKCLSEASQYLHPKRKAIEHSGGIETKGGVLLVEKVATADEWISKGATSAAAIAAAASE